MKLIIILAMLILGSSLHAKTTRVGDYVKFKIDATIEDTQQFLLGSQEIQSFDHESNQYSILNEIVDLQSEEVIDTGVFKMTPEELNSKHYRRPGKECDSLGGEIVEVEVTAGKFMTCKVTLVSGAEVRVVWLGDVPFNLVKELYKDYDNGTRVVSELIEYNYQTP